MSLLGSLLVVDDEPEIADVVRDFFEGLGYSVNCALNGRDALVLASLSRPDAVILDIRMPGRGGDEVLRDLLTLDDSIAVVMLSGNDQERLARELLRAGAFDYVRKPFSLDNLQSVVELAMLVGKRKSLPDEATPWQCGPRSIVEVCALAQADARCGGCGERVGEGDTTAVRERRGLFHAACWLGRVGVEPRQAAAAPVGPLLDSAAAS